MVVLFSPSGFPLSLLFLSSNVWVMSSAVKELYFFWIRPKSLGWHVRAE